MAIISAIPQGGSSSGGGNSEVHVEKKVATIDGQTTFAIDLTTFDKDKDFVFVQSGITTLLVGEDFNVVDNSVVLTEGVPVGRTIGVYILKNVPMTDTEEMISGVYIEPGTIPLDRLEEIPTSECSVTSDIPLHLSVNADGGLRITYDDGL